MGTGTTRTAGLSVVRTALVVALLATTSGAQLVADFSADVVAGTNPLTVQFSDLSTGGTALAWIWDFGDGSVSSLKNPQHTYMAPGLYSVSLHAFASVIDEDVETKPDLIDVAPATFTGAFSAAPLAGQQLLVVSFTDTSVGPVDGWHWDFGDGSGSSLQNPLHTYYNPGSYTVTLTPSVGAQLGEPVVMPDLISITPAPLDTSFTVSATQIAGAWAVSFDRGDSGVTPTSVSWTFGDGATSNADDPTHVYVPEEAGALDVGLTVSYYAQQQSVVAAGLIDTAPGPFGRARSLDTQSVADACAADLDGDGDLDVVTAGGGSNTGAVRWYTNTDGLGSFSAATSLPGPTLIYRRVHVADLNGDGDPDVLATVDGQDPRRFLATGGGGFGAGLPVNLGLTTTDLATGDFDLDGDLDLAAVAQSNSLRSFANDGSGALSLLSVVTPGGADSVDRIVCTDVDADGDADLLACDASEPTRLYRNVMASGSSWHRQVLFPASSRHLAAVDLDGDGDLDVVASGVGAATAAWVPNEGGVFGAGTTLLSASESSTGALAAGDIDGDGLGDFVRGHVPPFAAPKPPVSWYSFTNDFQAPERLVSATSSVTDLELADLDGDGLLDLLFVGNGEKLLAWQRYAPPTRWDAAGVGLAGSTASPPVLQGLGDLAGGQALSLALSGAPASASTVLVLGLSELSVPFKGGVLVPFPDVLLPLSVDTNGQLVLNAVWPAGVPGGVPIHAQHWLLDAGGPVGFAASNAVVGVTLP